MATPPVGDQTPKGSLLNRNTFWGGIASLAITLAGSGYSYVSSLKSDIESQGRDIAVMRAQLNDLRETTRGMEIKLDRMFERGHEQRNSP